jgi:hypothetical protein
VCVIYLYIFNFENYNICYQPAAAALRRCKFSNSNMRALERERERARGQERERERERDEKEKREKVCKCNSLLPYPTHPPTKVNFRELFI